jgi:type I restriction enzyme S subunit
MSEVAQAIHSSPDGHIPQLRFPEFSGEWMTDELSNLIEISSNKFNPNTSNESKKCIELEHLSQETGELLGYTDSTAQASTKNAFTKGQVLFGKLRPYLKKFWLSQFDGVCSSEIWVLNGKKLANNYLFQFIQTNKFNQIANVSSGSKMPRSDWKYMVQVPFKYTTKPEQQKIAAFLTAVDNKIEQLSKKQALLGEYKKGLMQQIFSQAIRFKADDGSDFPDWKENKVDEFMEVTRGQVLAVPEMRQVESEIFKYPVYSSQTKNNGLTGYYTDYLFEDCITWTTDGANAGDVNYRAGKFYCTNVCGVLRSKKGYANLCIAQILNSVSRRYVSYVGNPKLMNNVMEKIKISIPSSINEQTKIANFLSSVDSKIEEVGKQLDESKQFKKALLQKMFV